MTRDRARRSIAALAASLLVAGSGCKHVGEFVWIDTYAQTATPAMEGYVIAPGDMIHVRVWNQENLSGRVRVRADGKISLPFVNDVEAASLRPPALAERLQLKLKSFIVSPQVTVSVEEDAGLDVSVIGEVTKPGVYRFTKSVGVLEALAMAGGLTILAGRDEIFVLRYGEPRAGKPIRIRFTYEALTKAQGRAAAFTLRRGDLIVVE